MVSLLQSFVLELCIICTCVSTTHLRTKKQCDKDIEGKGSLQNVLNHELDIVDNITSERVDGAISYRRLHCIFLDCICKVIKSIFCGLC
jgi:hypothetical protein